MSAGKARWVVPMVVALMARSTAARCNESLGDADFLFHQGRAALEEENYEAARSYFEQSYKLEPTLGTLLNLAVCEEKLGKLTVALAHLHDAMDRAGPADHRRPLIAQRLARLESRVPRLTIQPTRAFGPDVVVSLDANRLNLGDIGKMLRIDPGTHVLDCAGPRGERCTIVFTVQEGQEAVQAPTLSEPVTAPAADPSPVFVPVAVPPPAPTHPGSGQRSFAYAAGGFGLASIVVGLIAGVSVLHQKDVVNAHCDVSGCDDEGLGAGQRGKTLSTISTIATGFGVVVTGASVYVLLSAPSSRDGAAGVTLRGSF